MGRSNLIVLGVGLAGAVALMMVLRSAVSIQAERGRAGLVTEVRRVLGTRLVGRPRIRETEVEGVRRVEADVATIAGADPRRLARAVGRALWRRLEGGEAPHRIVVGLEVADREVQRFEVPPPWRPRDPLRLLPPAAPPD